MKFCTLRGLARAAIVVLLGVSGYPVMAQAPQRFATVYKITGVVQASDPVSGAVRTVRQGDAVYVGEQIRSMANGEAVLRTDDAGVIAVRPNAYFVVDQFKAQGKPDDQLSVRILEGALRMITGWVGVLNKSGHKITTTSATIGIRGTDHEPYVLSPELAKQLHQSAGTYDKVNRGGTYLNAGSAQIEIDPGRVGFAPAPPVVRTRAMMTVLLPVLLEKVPGFFVPGAFDAELEGLAARDFSQALNAGQFVLPAAGAVVSAAKSAEAQPVNAAPAVAEPSAALGACDAQTIAQQWLSGLDASLEARDAAKFVAHFAPQADIQTHVKGLNVAVTVLKSTRTELAKSTFESLARLTQFSSRRPVTTGKVAGEKGACKRIEVESVVIESGVLSGGAYRLEALEKFTLELQGERWLAVRAITTQN
jgi:hypothetical protein